MRVRVHTGRSDPEEDAMLRVTSEQIKWHPISPIARPALRVSRAAVLTR
jgi:hypothetical protein